MRGTESAYYCPPFAPYMIQSAAAFAAAAREARLESVVVLSQWLAGPAHPSLLTRQSWLAERVLTGVPGLASTILNPGFFADNYLRLIGFAAHLGIFPALFGDSRNAVNKMRPVLECMRSLSGTCGSEVKMGLVSSRPPASSSHRKRTCVIDSLLFSSYTSRRWGSTPTDGDLVSSTSR